MAFNLLYVVKDGVSEDKVSFCSGMGVKIQVHEGSLFLIVVLSQFFDSVARGLFDWIWILVVTVQILIKHVHPTVAVRNAIGVEHGNKDKDKELSEEVSPHIVFV